MVTLNGGTLKAIGPVAAGVPPANALGLWTFDNPALRLEDTGVTGAYHGTGSNGIAFTNDTPRGRGMALDLRDAFEYVVVNTNVNHPLGPGNDSNQDTFDSDSITVAAWVKGWPADWQPFVSKGDLNTGAWEGWELRKHGDWTTLDWSHALTTGGRDMPGHTNTVADQEWHHIAATTDSATGVQNIYVDGVLDNTRTLAVGGTIIGTPAMVAFGAKDLMYLPTTGNTDSGVQEHFDGKLDEIAIYDYALTAAEIADLYGAPSALDATMSNISVSAPSTIDTNGTTSATFGTITMNNGGILSTKGAPVVVNNLSIPAGVANVGVDPQVTTTYTINNASAAVTLAKAGPSTWTINTPAASGAANIDWAVDGGILEVEGPGTPLAARPLSVNTGGTLRITSNSNLTGTTITLNGGTAEAFNEPTVPAAGMLAGWTYDDTFGRTAMDVSGNGNHAVLMGGPSQITFEGGLVGGAMHNAVTQDIPPGAWWYNAGYASAPGVDVSNKSFTLSVWAKRQNQDMGNPKHEEYLITQTANIDGGVPGSQGLHMGFRNEWNATFAFWGDDLNISDLSINDEDWHLWTATYVDMADATNPGLMTLYRDGQWMTQRVAVNGDYTGTGNMVLGQRFEARSWENFDGMMDDTYVYDRALTAAEVAGLAGVGDLSLSTVDFDVTGPSTVNSGYQGKVTYGKATLKDGGGLSTRGRETVFSGGVVIAGAAATSVTLDPRGRTSYGGPINNTVPVANMVTIGKTGPSTLTLQPITGVTGNLAGEVSGGVMELRGNNVFGGGPIEVMVGGTLDLNDSASTGASLITVDGGRILAKPAHGTLPAVGSANLIRHYDATFANADDEGYVRRWTDLTETQDDFWAAGNETWNSGLRQHFQPDLVTDAFNGQDAIRFDGDDVMTAGLRIENPYTIFTVARLEGTQNGRLISSQDTNWLLGWHANRDNVMYANGWVSDWSDDTIQPSTNQIHLHEASTYDPGTGLQTDFFVAGDLIRSNNLGTASPGILQLASWSTWHNETSTA
jgi:hypothetical protein